MTNRSRATFAPYLSASLACLTLLAQQAAHAQSFPYKTGTASSYAYGLDSVSSNQSSDNSSIQTFYNNWKANWITTTGAGGGSRVLFQGTSGKAGDTTLGTVSEGTGYGMLFAVYFGDQALLDSLYKYAKAHFNNNGVMDWELNADGSVYTASGVDGSRGATDGDEDIAAALCFAASKWGSSSNYNYTTEATALINNIAGHEIDPNYVVEGGDYTLTPTQFNPSYFAPAWYRIFGSITGNTTFWNNVINTGYAIVKADQDNCPTALPSRFCDATGAAWSGYTYQYNEYEYNAFRVPFRCAIDYSWFGEPRGQTVATRIANFYHSVINTDHTQLYNVYAYSSRDRAYNGWGSNGNTGANQANYAADGTYVLDKFESGSFTGTAGAANMAGADTGKSNAYYQDASYLSWCEIAGRATDTQYYFDGAWNLFSSLYETGNFPNLYSAGGTPTFSATASLSPSTVTPGGAVTASVNVTCNSGALANGIVDIELRSADGSTQILQDALPSQSFTSGQTRSFNWNFNAPSAAASYQITVGVFSAGWSSDYSWQSNLATLTDAASTLPTPHSGSWEVKVSPAGGWTSLAQGANVSQNTSYTATAWLQGTGSIRYRVLTNDWSTELAAGNFTPSSSSSWNQVSLNFNSGSNSAVVIDFADTQSGGTLYIDDVALTDPNGNNLIGDGDFEQGTGQTAWLVQSPFSIVDPVKAGPPAAPSGLKATAGATGTKNIALTWAASTGATSYTVYRGTTAGGESATAIATGVKGTAYTNTGLTAGTKYYYKIAAVSSAGTSAKSNEANATAR